VHAVDLDEDGDVDVLSAAYNANDINWYENDGNESFTEHMIVGNLMGANSVMTADIDNDDDIDIFASGWSGGVTWLENDGSESFTEHTIADDFSGCHSIFAIDLDGDDDCDLLGAAYNLDELVWWENGGPAGLDPEEGVVLPRAISLSQNYPNPFNPSTTIEFDLHGTNSEKKAVSIVVYDIRGKRVRMLVDSEFQPGSHRIHWNGRNIRGETVPSGVYMYTLKTGKEVFSRKMTLLK